MLLLRFLFLFLLLSAPLCAQNAAFHFDKLPNSLQAVRGVHPRLYLNEKRVAELRRAMETTHAALWLEIKAQADQLAKSGPPPYREKDASSGDEQLYQRAVGNAMPPLALAYQLTGDKKYLDAARAWALASCGYATWGLGKTDGMDLATGHQLFGLALVYDWCFKDLDEATRTTIRQTLIKRGTAMFQAVAAEKVWWYRSYLQNHLWVNVAGLQAAGLAIFDEHEAGADWAALALDKLKQSVAALGPDGASHEGVGYWSYGVEYLLKLMFLSRELLDVNLYDHPWWKNTATYYHYLTIPRHAWTTDRVVVDIADSSRKNWYGPDYLLRALAREYRDGTAQWLAQEVDDANVDSPESRWLNLLWFDPNVAPVAPAASPKTRPTLRHFEDMGIVSARSDWSGDESLLAFKCGPFIGHEAMQKFSYDPGGGHVHPDANHFVLFGNGEWLIRDDGYRAKWTGQHNTLLIGGKGQLGEGQQWFDAKSALKAKSLPRVLRAQSSPQLDFISGDATSAYDSTLGLQRYRRHLLFLKPDIIIVLDDIALDAPRPLELRFHPESQDITKDGTAFLLRGKTSVLRVEPFASEGVTVAAEDVAGQGRIGENVFSMFTVRLSAERASWRQATAFSWAKAGTEAPRVTLSANGSRWTFKAAARQVEFDWEKEAAQAR